MNCLGWNCRCLGNFLIVHELHLLVKTKSPLLVFLIETKCCREKVEMIRNKIRFENSFVVNNRGWSGGLALL